MISHPHRTVFVHIPKCGGQSLETAYLADLGLTWQCRGPLLMRPNDRPEIGPPRLSHLLARQYVAHHWLSAELWAAYFTFALVRNPFARVLSMFNYTRYDGSLADYVADVLQPTLKAGDAGDGQYYFVRPQVDFVTDAEGAVLVDRVYRLEELDKALAEIRARSRLQSAVPHANRSERRAEMADFAPEVLATVRALYAADFQMFGYPDTP